MKCEEVLKVIKKTDEIVDNNPHLRTAAEKILNELFDKTGATEGAILIYDIFDKVLKTVFKVGNLGPLVIKQAYKEEKVIQKGRKLAVPIIIDKERLGAIYLFGKVFTKDDVERVVSTELILDGKVKSEMDSKGLKAIFERYVGEKTMKKILANPDERELTGKTHNSTILFADINGFTKYTNNQKAKKVVELLNHYFKEMTQVVLKRDGTVDKFIGDAIMAVFGSPLSQKDHATKAIETAQEMIKKMREIAREYNMPDGGLSVGIATGKVVAGNIGTEKMTDYTVIGKKVNLAARLTALAKKNQILVDEATKKSAKKFDYRDLGKVEIKGFEKIRVFKLKLR